MDFIRNTYGGVQSTWRRIASPVLPIAMVVAVTVGTQKTDVTVSWEEEWKNRVPTKERNTGL
jgi:hypothetical protein